MLTATLTHSTLQHILLCQGSLGFVDTGLVRLEEAPATPETIYCIMGTNEIKHVGIKDANITQGS